MTQKEAAAGDPEDFLFGGGEMGQRMREKDWSRTVFGPVDNWPRSLKTSISIMLESRFAMVIAWGPDFRFFYNDRYRPVLGATKHPAALGTPASEIFPEAWPFIGPLFESTRQGESVALDDVLIPLERYGYLENCYFTLSYSAIRDESGGVGGMLAVVAETTERVEGERRLKTLRELARRSAEAKTAEEACRTAAATLAENDIDVPFAAFYLLDDKSDTARLVACSGVSAGSAAAPHSIDFSTGGNSGWQIAEAIESRQIHVLQNLHTAFGPLPGGPYPEHAHTAVAAPLARPGQARPEGIVIFGVSPRRALDDPYRGFYDLATDHILTGIRNALAYQEERRRAEALAELDRAKTAFFSNVSHEFRTPLTLMLGPLQDALESSAAGPETREQIEVAYRNSLRLLKLVNTLLDFSRIEAGRVEATYEPVDLGAYTAELASVFRSTAERAGLRFVVDCPPLSPPVYINREMWEKIVFNLLSNAFKFTFDGEIRTSIRATGTDVTLTVQDTGSGIPAEEIPHLFQRFHRVKGARGRTYEGTGIGLALVQELVKLHGGTVGVESDFGSGTAFRVTIPLGHAHLPQERVYASSLSDFSTATGQAYLEEALRWMPEESEAKAAPSQDERPVIVLADDNADMRQYVERLLSPRYRVIAAADGQAALEAIKVEKPDLIVSDVMMPRLDGAGLLRAVRSSAELRTIPVILLSAKAGEEARIDGLEAGADDYVVKPFSAQELIARIETHLQMMRIRRKSELTIRRLKDELQVQFEDLRRVHETTLRLAGSNLQALFPEVLDAAITITGADRAFISLLDAATGEWKFAAQKHLEYLLSHLPELQQSIGHPLSPILEGRRLLVEDITKSSDELASPGLDILIDAGIRAFQASPLVSRSGRILGMYSTLYHQPREFNEREMRLLDLLARPAADLLERAEVEEARRRSEERERARVLELEALMEALPAVVFISHDSDGKVISGSRAAYDMMRIPRGTNLSLTAPAGEAPAHFKVFIDGKEVTGDDLPVQAAARGRELHEVEEKVEFSDGSTVDLFGSAVPLRDSDDNIRGSIAAFVDITERKQAAQRLAMQYEVARILSEADRVEVALAGILRVVGQNLGWDAGCAWRLDVDGAGLSFLASWHSLAAPVPHLEAASRNMICRRGVGLPGKVWETLRPLWIETLESDPNFPRRDAAIADGVRTAVAFPIVFQDRLVGVLEFFSRNTRPEDDKLLMTLSAIGSQAGQFIQRKVVEDERGLLLAREQSARRQLEDEREILETVNRSGQMLSGQLELQKLVQALTDAATEITGAQFGSFFYNVLDERGASYMLYTLSGVPREHFSHFPMPRSTDLFGPTFRGEGTVRVDDVRKDPRYGKNAPYHGMPRGHLPVTSYLAVSVVSRSGEVLGGLFFGHSEPGIFTERHERIVQGLAGQAAIAIDNARLFEAAQKARSEAEMANRLKDEFLATVSHELRTPLNAMLGWARLLRSGRLDTAKQAQALETMERNAVAQQQIIEDILDVSRIITGKLRLDLSPIEVGPIVESAIDSIRPSADAKGVTVQSILETHTNLVLGDSSRLQQIVWNLLSNAVKFTQRGGRVQVSVQRADSSVEITVRDTGKGINKDFLPHVFERFRQADSSSTRYYGGLGLGLAIVRHLAELHGGSVYAFSPGEGQGATFGVRLPLAIIHDDPSRRDAHNPRFRPAEDAPSFEYGLSLDGIKVLAVDDEADARELLEVVLTQSRAEVRTAASTQEALDLVRDWKPDVLISDIGMPGEDGYSLIRKLRSMPADAGGKVPAAALTAYARSEDRVKAIAAGYHTHVAKPVDPAELIAVVASLAGRTGPA